MHATRYRRPSCLIAYWEAGFFFAENFLAGAKVKVSPAIMTMLEQCSEYETVGNLVIRFRPVPRVEAVLDDLIASSLLVAEGSEIDLRDRGIDRTWEWPINARFFHFSTQTVEYTFDFERLTEFFEAKARRSPPPSPFKHTDGPLLRLEADQSLVNMPLHDALAKRRTCRNFKRKAISFRQFSTVTSLTWGMTRYYNDSTLDRRIIKRVPSGGARHPIEAYAIALRVEGLEPAVYHYDVQSDAIVHLGTTVSEGKLEELFSGQGWMRDAAVAYVMTAFLPRSMWKYDHSRAYRVLLLDAGHVGQTFHLVATAIGLGAFTTAAIQDRALESLLGLDGIAETIVYGGAIGIPQDRGR